MELNINRLTICLYLITFGLGVYAGNILWNKPIQQTEIKSIEIKSGNVVRHIKENKDGTKQIDEVEDYKSDTSINVLSKTIEKNNSIGYIPKYDFTTNKLIHSGFYTYKNIGIYLSENKEAGLVFSFSW